MEGPRDRLLAQEHHSNVKSLFYILLMTGRCHTIDYAGGRTGKEAGRLGVIREGNLAYQKWFNAQDYNTPGSPRGDFFSNVWGVRLSQSFEGFRVWLLVFQITSRTVSSENAYQKRNQGAGGSVGGFVPFDNEMLGGCIDYPTPVEPICR